MSIFRNLLSCISTENFASAYVNNPLQAKNTFSNKTCIICHESVVTCLNNRSNKCYKYSSNLLGTPTKHEQSPGRQNIKTTQPETMTTICVSCTDAINNPLNDSEIHGLTSPSYRNSLTHPYDTDTTTVTMATDTLNGNHNSASTSLQCSKFLGRWIDYSATEWITTAATATTTTTTSTAMTTTRLDTLHQSYIISQKTQQESQNETSEQNNEDNTNDYINSSTNEESIEECYIPEPVFNLFLHLAQKGVYAKDLFRRPGNMAQIKHILHRFASNHTIDWKDYNIHTVATVAKRVLVNIPNGLIGLKGENQLLHTALLTQQQQHDSIQVKTIRRTFQSTLGVSSTGVTSKSSSEPANNLHGKTEDCMNTATITSVQQSQLSGNDNGENQTVTECTKQSDQIVRRATVIANIQSDKEINISLLFSYGSIQQIYQLTPIDLQRVQVFQSILRDLTSAHRQLTIMIFGILHQLVFNAAFNTAIQYSQQQESDKNSDEFPKIPLLKLAEGVVKSVAGSMFHTCTSSILLIDQTTQVLQSLVLCFPVVDKEFTQFYWDVLNNRYKLRKSKQTGRGATKINISKSVYSKSPCSARFINAAGRLFCFTNAIDATATANNNKNSSNNMLPKSTTKNRQSSQIYRESSIESSLYQNVSKAVEDQDKIMESIVVQPVQSIASSVHASDLTTIEKNDVKYSSYAKQMYTKLVNC
ncbi:unnamed protein product [Heterobilharzia americana]|nr:unnamed protein product [Heterobilharzia americana]